MDEGCSKAVRETFCNLYEKGLIYKGSRIINWCPHCVTALSDAEVEYVDKPGSLWYIRYPLSDGSGDIVVALLQGGEVTVKSFFPKTQGRIELRPANPEYNVQIYPASEVSIQGRVIELRRKY